MDRFVLDELEVEGFSLEFRFDKAKKTGSMAAINEHNRSRCVAFEDKN